MTDLNLSKLKPLPGAKHKPKRTGRGIGSGHGKTACRGYKGQNARAGRDKRNITFEGGQMPLIRRLPKRGFTNVFKTEYAIVNLSDLNQFSPGSVIGKEELIQAGLVKKKNLPVKILGNGEIQHPLTIRANKFSESARIKIEAKGGKAEVVK